MDSLPKGLNHRRNFIATPEMEDIMAIEIAQHVIGDALNEVCNPANIGGLADGSSGQRDRGTVRNCHGNCGKLNYYPQSTSLPPQDEHS